MPIQTFTRRFAFTLGLPVGQRAICLQPSQQCSAAVMDRRAIQLARLEPLDSNGLSRPSFFMAIRTGRSIHEMVTRSSHSRGWERHCELVQSTARLPVAMHMIALSTSKRMESRSLSNGWFMALVTLGSEAAPRAP